MKKIKKYLFLFMLSTIVFVAKGQYINDFVVDSANHKIYVAGSFYTYKGESRQHLAAIDSKTGKLLPWHPVIPSFVSPAITMDNNIIYAAGETRSDGYISAIDTNGNVISSLRANIKTIGSVACMTINNNLIYLSGGFEMVGGDVVHTIIIDKQGNRVPMHNDMSSVLAKKIIVTLKNTFLLTDKNLYVYDKSTTMLQKNVSLQINGLREYMALDFDVKNDTAFIVGSFGDDGGVKYDIKGNTLLTWPFKLNDGNCNPSSISDGNDPACSWGTNTYYAETRAIARYGDCFYVGGKINKKRGDGSCTPLEQPLKINTGNTVQTYELEGKKLFDADTNRRVRKYKIVGDILYYLTSAELCTGTNSDQYARRDKIGAYCLQPEMPGEFINSEDYPCIGQDYLYEVKESVPGRKYNWSCNVAGAKITPNGNKAIINFPYFKLEHNVSVTVVNECGVESLDRTMTVFGTNRPPVVYVSDEDKTLTCTRTSFPIVKRQYKVD